MDVSNPDKEIFPGIPKREFVAYYERIADRILPFLEDRPLALERFPDGYDGERFFQKNVPGYFPSWVKRVTVGDTTYAVCQDRQTLLYLANQVAVPHPWLSRRNALKHPDMMVFDLDPDGRSFGIAKEAARDLKELLERVGLVPFLKTTGSEGLHVAVPLKPDVHGDNVREFAKTLCTFLAERKPGKYTVEHRKEKRGKRLLLDYFRNTYAQTAVAPYAVRPRKEAPIAAPIQWDSLDGLQSSREYTSDNVPGETWKDFFQHARSLSGIRRAP